MKRSAEQMDHIDWAIPAAAEPGGYRVEMEVRAPDGRVLSMHGTDITVC